MMRRRDFVTRAAQSSAGFVLGMAGCARRKDLAPADAKNATLTRKLIATWEEKLPRWMEEHKVPGVSVVLIQDAKIAWRRGFGFKDRATQAPIDVDTMFEAASMSKPAFAYVVMKMAEKGVIHLDTPLSTYIAERFLVGDPRISKITARHVLSHTTGFPNWRSREEPLKIHFTPGERYQYSGEGYYYLQSVLTHLVGRVDPRDCVEFADGLRVCATDFEAYMRANLFVPFGMHSSGYLWNDRVAGRMARPHDDEGRPQENKKSTSPSVARYGSAGALLTTPTDYAKFLIETIAPKPPDAFRLSAESAREMLRPHIKLEGGRYPASWALGWQIFHNEARDFVYHGGDNTGFHCCAVASVAGQSGFVVMTNAENGPTILTNLLVSDVTQQFLAA
jgi:CubicO group peptidase (beta-lactamase class C family)